MQERTKQAIATAATDHRRQLEELKRATFADREYLTSVEVRRRYGVTEMTIWRWLHDEALEFPRPMIIGRRRYFRLTDLEAWESARPTQSARGARK